MKEVSAIQSAIDSYTLGILWATCSKIGDQYIVRNEDRYFADYICKVQGGSVFEITHSRKGTVLYCIKIKKPLYTAMEALDWTGRTDKYRAMPDVDEPDEFCRAYVQCHYNLGFMRNNRPRLRFHGTKDMMESFSKIISRVANVGEKKVQCHSSGRTYSLYYQSPNEIYRIFDWICSGDHSEKVLENFSSLLTI